MDAAEPVSQKVSAEISGSGQVVVTVSRELRVDISGAGTVTYFASSVSGSGKVIKK